MKCDYLICLGNNYTISTYDPGTLTVIAAPLTVTATNESMTYGSTVPTLTYTYTGLVNDDTSATFTGSLVTTATSSSNVSDYPITQGTLAATGNYTIDTFNPSTLSIAKTNAIVVVAPYSVTYDGSAHNATGTATGINGVSLNGLVVNSAHTNAGTYTDTWTFTDTTGNYIDQTGTVVDTIAKANAIVVDTPYSVFYNCAAYTATGAAYGVNDVALAGLNLNSTVHTNAGTYTDTWTFSNPNYNSASGTITDTIIKANASIVVNGYNVNYDGAAHEATGAAYGVNGVALSGLNLNGTVHVGVGTYYDTWTFSNPNYNSPSGTVVDVVHPAPVSIVSVAVQKVRLGKTKKTTQVIVVQFSGTVDQALSNYSLVTIPPNKRVKSKVVVLSKNIYNPANNTVQLVTRNPLVLSTALKLTVNVHDTIDRHVTGTATITKHGVTLG
jgi:MBG domain (YGX type)